MKTKEELKLKKQIDRLALKEYNWTSLINDKDRDLYFGTTDLSVYHVWKTLNLFRTGGLRVKLYYNGTNKQIKIDADFFHDLRKIVLDYRKQQG